MKRLINKLTGGEMWVADSREKEYLEAGHKPASFTEKPTKIVVSPPQPEPEEVKSPEPETKHPKQTKTVPKPAKERAKKGRK